MKFLFSIVLFFSLLSASSVDSKIAHSKKKLSVKKTEYKKMDRELAKIAKNIFQAKKDKQLLANKLKKLENKIQKNETELVGLELKEKKLLENLEHIGSKISVKEKKFLDLVAKNFSLALALEEINQPTPDSVVMREVYEVYAQKNRKEIARLKKEIDELKRSKLSLKLQKSNINKIIEIYALEKKEYDSKNREQEKLVKKLAKDKAIYKKRFNKIISSRKSLEKRLAKLKIIKRDREQAARAKARAKRASQQQRAVEEEYRVQAPEIIERPRTTRYRGGKTISPLKGSVVIKKFGTYIDPIYKFKIFNKSITLKSPYAGAKVRAVLDGKIVFAENSGGMLGKVVILEHSNGMHTIYAKLSRLAPGIRVGKKLSRSSVIGKVEKSLMFEVTKNNKHINPLNLIRL